jgi:hypothetical protein
MLQHQAAAAERELAHSAAGNLQHIRVNSRGEMHGWHSYRSTVTGQTQVCNCWQGQAPPVAVACNSSTVIEEKRFRMQA